MLMIQMFVGFIKPTLPHACAEFYTATLGKATEKKKAVETPRRVSTAFSCFRPLPSAYLPPVSIGRP